MGRPTYAYEDVLGRIVEHPEGSFTLELADGETAWNPSSTKTLLRGPATVRYNRHADGGWNASLEEDS